MEWQLQAPSTSSLSPHWLDEHSGEGEKKQEVLWGGKKEDEQHGWQQGEVGQCEAAAAAAGGVVCQEGLRRLIERVIWQRSRERDINMTSNTSMLHLLRWLCILEDQIVNRPPRLQLVQPMMFIGWTHFDITQVQTDHHWLGVWRGHRHNKNKKKTHWLVSRRSWVSDMVSQPG